MSGWEKHTCGEKKTRRNAKKTSLLRDNEFASCEHGGLGIALFCFVVVLFFSSVRTTYTCHCDNGTTCRSCERLRIETLVIFSPLFLNPPVFQIHPPYPLFPPVSEKQEFQTEMAQFQSGRHPRRIFFLEGRRGTGEQGVDRKKGHHPNQWDLEKSAGGRRFPINWHHKEREREREREKKERERKKEWVSVLRYFWVQWNLDVGMPYST